MMLKRSSRIGTLAGVCLLGFLIATLCACNVPALTKPRTSPVLPVAETGKPVCFAERIPIPKDTVNEIGISGTRRRQFIVGIGGKTLNSLIDVFRNVGSNNPFRSYFTAEIIKALVPSTFWIIDWTLCQKYIQTQDTSRSFSVVYTATANKHLISALGMVYGPRSERQFGYLNPSPFGRNDMLGKATQMPGMYSHEASLRSDSKESEDQRPCRDAFGPCYEFVPPLHAIGAAFFLLSGYAIVAFVDGRKKLISLPCVILGGCILLSGHQFHCRDGNDYRENEYCQPFEHDANRIADSPADNLKRLSVSLHTTPIEQPSLLLPIVYQSRQRP